MADANALAQTLPAPSMDPDSLLVERSREGEHNAFSELVIRHQRRIWMVCRQYLAPDEADEATQDAFVKAYTNIKRFDGRAAFTTWVTRIAINTCLDRLRRQRREGLRAETDDDGPSILEQMVDDRTGPERRAEERQAVARLAELEQELPNRQREIFRLRFYAELELEDIATSLGVHIGTVKTQLHRAVHRLRKELGGLR